MEIDKKLVEDIAIVAISGKIDAITSRELDSTLMELLNQNTAKIVIDLKEVDFISSGGIRVFIAFKKKLIERKGDLVVSSLQPFVTEIFEMTGLPSLISIYPSQGEAVKSLKS
ncbi:MAG: STAS domain-containing protein [Methanotrichaceae archaeon]